MGILNTTPDSFSDGGTHDSYDAAVAHGRTLVSEGAAIIDIGGESTRPGAPRVEEEEELRRVIPVVKALSDDGIVVSVDTMRASVAAASIDAGALIINDVSGGLADPEMIDTCTRARTRLGLPPVGVVMHWRGHSDVAKERAVYTDAAQESHDELARSINLWIENGFPSDYLVADPGFGFSKTAEHNWDIFADWDLMRSYDLPLLIGVSRKRFLTAQGHDRDEATAALSAISAAEGAWAVRVHDVAANAAAVAMGSQTWAAREARRQGRG